MIVQTPCADCKMHKTRNLPLLGMVSGCVNKKIDAKTYVRLSTRGGDCTEKAV